MDEFDNRGRHDVHRRDHRRDRPGAAGSDLAEWVAERSAELAEFPEIAAEVPTLTPSSFASRSLQSRYLNWVFETAVDSAPAHVDVRVHRRSVVDIVNVGETQTVHLDDGAVIDATTVLLAQGHPDALPPHAKPR
ncbi:FAD/NAD(P)-binding protein [Rhodococcus sp. 3Y1]